MELETLIILGKTPTAMLQICFLLIIPLSQDIRLLPILVVGIFAFARFERAPSSWKSYTLEPQTRELAARLDTRVAEQFDLAVSARTLGRCADFESAVLPDIMARAYSTYWRCACSTYLATITEVLHAVFRICAKVVVVQVRAAGGPASNAMLLDMVTCMTSSIISGMSALLNVCTDQAQKYSELTDFLNTDCVEPHDSQDAPPDWPPRGCIELDRVTFRYAPYTPPALRNVTLRIAAQEKVGIVGRTGAGKSTLASLLLRLGPLRGLAPGTDGRVLLDGLDIAQVPLVTLRRAVAVVPQEATMFAQSLKENLGGEEFTDAEVLAALQQCGLDARKLTEKDTLQEALATELSVSAFSLGQRQLFTTARALLRRPVVLILDECTASLDREAADQLLGMIREHCRNMTVLSIAHRLRFVTGADRILVLGEGGQMLAFDTPAALMQDEAGYFATCLRQEQREEQGMLGVSD